MTAPANHDLLHVLLTRILDNQRRHDADLADIKARLAALETALARDEVAMGEEKAQMTEDGATDCPGGWARRIAKDEEDDPFA